MNRAQVRRLEAAGWKVGDAAEFLGLTPEESALIDIKVSLIAALRALRERRGWTQTRLARRVGSSQSRIAKMENGDWHTSIDLLIGTLLALGATRREVGRIIGSRAA